MGQCDSCEYSSIDENQPPCRDCVWSNKYRRKRWLFLCRWLLGFFMAVVSALLLALLLCGCVHARQGDFEYWRLGNQQIGEALLTLPDGSELLLDGQKSELPKVEITATSITIGGKVLP